MAAYRVNEPQAKAIHGALKTRGFSLIQGSVVSPLVSHHAFANRQITIADLQELERLRPSSVLLAPSSTLALALPLPSSSGARPIPPPSNPSPRCYSALLATLPSTKSPSV